VRAVRTFEQGRARQRVHSIRIYVVSIHNVAYSLKRNQTPVEIPSGFGPLVSFAVTAPGSAQSNIGKANNNRSIFGKAFQVSRTPTKTSPRGHLTIRGIRPRACHLAGKRLT
jgi:hypothetical protein